MHSSLQYNSTVSSNNIWKSMTTCFAYLPVENVKNRTQSPSPKTSSSLLFFISQCIVMTLLPITSYLVVILTLKMFRTGSRRITPNMEACRDNLLTTSMSPVAAPPLQAEGSRRQQPNSGKCPNYRAPRIMD